MNIIGVWITRAWTEWLAAESRMYSFWFSFTSSFLFVFLLSFAWSVSFLCSFSCSFLFSFSFLIRSTFLWLVCTFVLFFLKVLVFVYFLCFKCVFLIVFVFASISLWFSVSSPILHFVIVCIFDLFYYYRFRFYFTFHFRFFLHLSFFFWDRLGVVLREKLEKTTRIQRDSYVRPDKVGRTPNIFRVTNLWQYLIFCFWFSKRKENVFIEKRISIHCFNEIFARGYENWQT